ncbi:acetyl-coenzyme A synthetase-like [Frankliniella occidentalis]|uniref:Acetyl-coenzyme A synthetase-like n=1 Tax=Frankliniella occidentalis TaxID=133901 RepID=A0A6J1S5X4_FRAOC|nr:acetyl-coenzyme A synthetase-like [Frankliniella occidentalis]
MEKQIPAVFAPNAKLSKNAFVSSMAQYEEMYKKSIDNPEEFWLPVYKQFHWETSYTPGKFLDYNFDMGKGPVQIKWLDGATTNICYNLLDRNVRCGNGDKIAYYW